MSVPSQGQAPNPNPEPVPSPAPPPSPTPTPAPVPSPTPTPAPPVAPLTRFEVWRFVVEIALCVAALLTLLFLSWQTEAARQQAFEAEKQSAGQRLDGLYQHLLQRREFLADKDNSELAPYVWGKNKTPLESIPDRAERERVETALSWDLLFADYAYAVLPDLIGEECVPDDGHFVLRADNEAAHTCDDWLAWSEYLVAHFRDPRLCEMIKGARETYGTDFIQAIDRSGACDLLPG